MESTGSTKPIQSLQRAFDVIESLREERGTVSEVAAAVDMPVPTVYRYLETLRSLDLVMKTESQYQLGCKFVQLGESVVQRETAAALAEEKLTELSRTTGERCQFVIEEHGEAVYLKRETGEKAVKTDSAIGKRVPLHATAAGKAILSCMPDARIERIVSEKGLEPVTENTITEYDRLREELSTVEERGYAVNDEEYIYGLRAVAVPVHDSGGDVVGSISISAPKNRIKDDEINGEISDLLMSAANELELKLIYEAEPEPGQ